MLFLYKISFLMNLVKIQASNRLHQPELKKRKSNCLKSYTALIYYLSKLNKIGNEIIGS